MSVEEVLGKCLKIIQKPSYFQNGENQGLGLVSSRSLSLLPSRFLVCFHLPRQSCSCLLQSLTTLCFLYLSAPRFFISHCIHNYKFPGKQEQIESRQEESRRQDAQGAHQSHGVPRRMGAHRAHASRLGNQDARGYVCVYDKFWRMRHQLEWKHHQPRVLVFYLFLDVVVVVVTRRCLWGLEFRRTCGDVLLWLWGVQRRMRLMRGRGNVRLCGQYLKSHIRRAATFMTSFTGARQFLESSSISAQNKGMRIRTLLPSGRK